MATHAPILMALPDARLLAMGRYGLDPVELEDIPHFRIQRQFALDPHGVVRDELEGWSGN